MASSSNASNSNVGPGWCGGVWCEKGRDMSFLSKIHPPLNERDLDFVHIVKITEQWPHTKVYDLSKVELTVEKIVNASSSIVSALGLRTPVTAGREIVQDRDVIRMDISEWATKKPQEVEGLKKVLHEKQPLATVEVDETHKKTFVVCQRCITQQQAKYADEIELLESQMRELQIEKNPERVKELWSSVKMKDIFSTREILQKFYNDFPKSVEGREEKFVEAYLYYSSGGPEGRSLEDFTITKELEMLKNTISTLSLSAFLEVSAQSLQKLAKFFPHLIALDLGRQRFLDVEKCASLPRELQMLQVCIDWDVQQNPDELFEKICTACPKLQVLDVSDSYTQTQPGRFRGQKHIPAKSVGITGSTLKALPDSVSTLNIRGCRLLEDEALQALTLKANLRILDISHTGVTGKGSSLLNLPKDLLQLTLDASIDKNYIAELQKDRPNLTVIVNVPPRDKGKRL